MAIFIDSFPGRTIQKDGEEYLYFGGTSYLGLQLDTEFQNVFIKNLKRYGTNYGASRKSNIQLSIFDEVEEHLSAIVGSEACVTLSSGFLAGQLIAKSFSSDAYQVFYAPNTHSALYHSEAKSFETFAELNFELRKQLRSESNKVPVVFLDSIDFSGKNYPEFEALRALPLDNIVLVADDSHGLGVVDTNGSGAYSKLRDLLPKELIVCGSLGKGFGIQAGAIFGTQQRIEALKKTDFFGGASPAAPAVLATLMDSIKIYEQKREVLNSNIELFLRNLNNTGRFDFMTGHPAFSFSNESLVAHLEENKIVVTNFRYPSEVSSLKSRIVLSTSHKKEDIEHLAECINILP
ncbi:MAG: aminotransferase class I/II-fold pyridoxal phosphate-dependent enzyme [Flavobacteriaceae bacterium]